MAKSSSANDGAKQAMRTTMRERLTLISAEARTRGSLAACHAVAASRGFLQAQTVMLYLAIAAHDGPGEVDPQFVARRAIELGKRLTFPRIDWDAKALLPIEVASATPPAEVRRHGVPEPIGGQEINLVEIDLVIVPGLAFDATGGRLGRGAGFYDRFLAEWRNARGTRGVAIGVAFDAQLVEAVPIREHDARVDAVATETGLFSTARGIL